LVAAAGFGVFGFALAGSVYPPPQRPWNLMPYIFAATVAAGVASSCVLGLIRAPEVPAEAA
jgi:hypothetical protein